MARALRFLTAGSVDDGKSTLIGRLLFDSRAILADQLETLERRAANAPRRDDAGPAFDLSLLTDGLEAEREQGITIDVAFRYFATPARKFIIADAPGHEQYTRNMVTAAAGSDAAVVLVDVTKLAWQQQPVALLPQTRRHALLAQLLRVPSIVFAINKLDAVDDPQTAFDAVNATLLGFARDAGMAVAAVVPVSALRGDNVTSASPSDAEDWQAWYRGPTLLEVLHTLPTAAESSAGPLALPLQYIGKDSGKDSGNDSGQHSGNGGGAIGHRPRTLWGRIAQGSLQTNDAVQIFPSGETARVVGLRQAGGSVASAEAGQSVGVLLDRHLDASRGDWIGAPGTLQPCQRFTATLAWLDNEPAQAGRKYWLRHGNRWVLGRIASIEHVLDIHTLVPQAAKQLAVNEIGRVTIETQQPLPVQRYADNRIGGALIVVDATSNRTSGALLVESLEAESP